MKHPTPPLELRSPVPHESGVGGAMHEAFKAALNGDFAPLDKIEIDFLNLLVRIGELRMKHADGEKHWWHVESTDAANAPFVTAILRGFGPGGRQALEWGLYEKCRQCDGKLRRLPCRICGGRWYLDDKGGDEVVYTDVDGVLLEGQE